ncbi:MAG: histidinol-phosphate transaminase, partial [Candidatus Aminicenantes bacterium]|nr:histidinol-phosphate transaminase [Candidatus Aminicenantes bacterium]
YIESRSNVMILKYDKLSGIELKDHLEKNGILVAVVTEEEAISPYIRLTLGSDADNLYFADVLRKI